MRVLLASASPRRREILCRIGLAPDLIVPADADETLPADIAPREAVQLLAERKALCVLPAAESDDLLIASDTVVALDGEILGKPKDRADAYRMLRLLSGKIHEVYTGVCLYYKEQKEVFSVRTAVEFYPLTEQEINAYLDTGEPFDKAGAYGIQGWGCLLVKRIDGDFFSVMGLPAAETRRAADKLMGNPLFSSHTPAG